MTQPLGPNQERWLRELETTDKKQGKKLLRSKDDKYCCLGVGCELIGLTPKAPTEDGYMYGADEDEWVAPDELIENLGLHDCCGYAKHPFEHRQDIAGLNDTGKTFKEIAAIIRADPSMYFREPR